MYNWDKINFWLSIIIVVALILIFFFKKPSNINDEYFRYQSGESCEELQAQYCMMMKSGRINPLGEGAQQLLYKIKQTCGNNYHLNLEGCNPSWAYTQGGVHEANLMPILANLE
jgi:hypothetical protein